jgi:hypothetical protein
MASRGEIDLQQHNCCSNLLSLYHGVLCVREINRAIVSRRAYQHISFLRESSAVSIRIV